MSANRCRLPALLLQVVKKAAAALGYLCMGHSGQPVPAVAAAAAPAAAAEPAAAAAGESGPAAVRATDPSSIEAAAAKAASVSSDRVLQPSVAALLGLRTSKNEEVLFGVGEALCFCFGGASAALGLD